jgi:hypothetical protein
LEIVQATTPLREVVERLKNSAFLLVESHESGMPDGISGIINHADLQKLPIRLLLFSYIVEIETRLRSEVESKNPKWSENDRFNGIAKRAIGMRKRSKSNALELHHYLNLNDFGIIMRQTGIRGFPGEDRFQELVYLRNNLAHSNLLIVLGGKNESSIKAVSSAFNLVEEFLNAIKNIN